MSDVSEQFVRGMALRRVDLCLDQNELQRKAFGRSGAVVRNLESREFRRVDLRAAHTIAVALDATLDELIAFGTDDSKDVCDCGHGRHCHPDEPWDHRTKGGYGKTSWKRYCHGHKGYDPINGETPCRCKGFFFKGYTSW
ncbi:hypothetical protein SEA_REYNAULD_77 [Rhodococcus phage Reynauld]|uniref:Uncharacterized protein n=1 Tax=Rhodococcus phage Reynauld TaxID=3062845 RepID=A0ACD4UHL5_9CAUD|nr:hypothetical protein SEA_REYNAULD_77 [Rhodococcus phage Reynauld]